MKITIEKQSLGRELALLQQYVLDKKVGIPALSHIRLTASSPHGLQLAGTDLDVTLTSEIEATVSVAGSCTLPGRKLCDIVKNLPDAPVTLTLKDNQRVEITCGRSQFKLAGLPVEDFPELPRLQETSVHLPARVMHTLIERTRFAITQEEARYTLSGAKFSLSAAGVRLVTTDGHRLALAETRQTTSEQPLACLIPKKALNALAQLAAGHEGAIGWHSDANHLYCEIGSRALVCRLLHGEFPDYAKIIPSQWAQQIEMSCGELLATVRRVAVMAEDNVRGLYLEFKTGQLRIFTDAHAQGAAEEVLPVSYTGAPVTLGLNGRYLSEYLAVINNGPVAFAFNSPRSVVQLSPLNDPTCHSLVLIMPLALPHSLENQTEAQPAATAVSATAATSYAHAEAA